jgi:large subunit ribosomal protein L9
MRVILQQDIPNLGEAGDIRTVKNGYGRNFLLPRNLVLLATASNEKQRKHQERISKLKKDKKEKEAGEMAQKLSGLSCEFKVHVGDQGKLYGSITALDIAEKLRDQGYSIDKRKVQLPEPFRNLGEYVVKVKLAQGVESSVKVRITDFDGNLVAQIKAKESSDEVAQKTEETEKVSSEESGETDQATEAN